MISKNEIGLTISTVQREFTNILIKLTTVNILQFIGETFKIYTVQC